MPTLADFGAALARSGFHPDIAGGELSVPLSGDEGDARAVFCKMLPLAEWAGLLTFSTSYPFGAQDGNLDDARLGAHECTQWLPLGAFQVDDDGTLHLRYSLVVARELPPDEVLAGLVGLIDYQQLHFGDYLAQLLGGQIGIELFAELVEAGEAAPSAG